jgi:hypothetical protein
MNNNGRYLLIGILVTIFLVIPVAQHGLPLFWWTFHFWNVNPIGFILSLAVLIFAARAGWEFIEVELSWGILGGAVMSAILIGWFIIYQPMMLVGLNRETQYIESAALVEITKPRDVSYAEALTNFKGNDPDARYKVGDLDYLEGRWIASYDPQTIGPRLSGNTSGFYQYLPNAEGEKAPITFQEFPFAENGLLWNSLGYKVHQGQPFVHYYETLYLEDPQAPGTYMTVLSLVKRHGWRRVPYVSGVMIIHADGREEILSPLQATNDERLEGIQLSPEWLEKLRVKAAGWPHDILTGLLFKTDRIEIHESNINEENSPPFHLETYPYGNAWVTPIGALNSESFFGVAFSFSEEINGPVYIWRKPTGGTYDGIDLLAATIKAAPHQGENVQWLKLSGEGVRAGQHDVIEMLPLYKDGELYFMGYVSSDPPKAVLFYTIINPETEVVYENLYSIDDVIRWRYGEIELKPQARDHNTPTVASTPNGINLDSMTRGQLLQLMRDILDRLEDSTLNFFGYRKR